MTRVLVTGCRHWHCPDVALAAGIPAYLIDPGGATPGRITEA
jgi:hypothetical protein